MGSKFLSCIPCFWVLQIELHSITTSTTFVSPGNELGFRRVGPVLIRSSCLVETLMWNKEWLNPLSRSISPCLWRILQPWRPYDVNPVDQETIRSDGSQLYTQYSYDHITDFFYIFRSGFHFVAVGPLGRLENHRISPHLAHITGYISIVEMSAFNADPILVLNYIRLLVSYDSCIALQCDLCAN